MNNSKIMSKVFLWMFIGLAVTFLTGSYIANDPSLILEIFEGGSVFLIFIVELAIVIFLTARIHKMKPLTAKIMFLLVFLSFNKSSIIVIFSCNRINICISICCI